MSEGRLDRAGVAAGATRSRLGGETRERSEETGAELDEEDAELEAAGGQAVASAGPDPLDQAMGAELAEIVTELAQAIRLVGEAVTGEQATVNGRYVPIRTLIGPRTGSST